MNFEHGVTIDRPIEEVFSFVSNPENDLQWKDRLVSVRDFEGGMEVGTRWTRTVRAPGGRSENVEECTRYETPTTFGYRTISGRTPVEATYTLTVADGKTALTYAGTMEFHGLLGLLAPLVRGRIDDEIGSSIERLAEVIETTSPARTDTSVPGESAM